MPSKGLQHLFELHCRDKGANKKKHEENELSKSQTIWKKNIKALILSNLISFSFRILFEPSKQLSMHQLELYKTSLKSIDNIGKMLKDFKFQITNAFKTPLTKPWTPVGDSISFYFLSFLNNLHNFECAKWRSTKPPWTLEAVAEDMSKDFKLSNTPLRCIHTYC